MDLGKGIGSGHFFRCLAVAQELQKNGKEVIFLYYAPRNDFNMDFWFNSNLSKRNRNFFSVMDAVKNSVGCFIISLQRLSWKMFFILKK